MAGTEAVMALLARGEKARHFGETKMNVNSSRSHTLFRMVRFACGFPRPQLWRETRAQMGAAAGRLDNSRLRESAESR